jgi:hypothetical protein
VTRLQVSRFNTTMLVVVGGMVIGHVLLPFRPGAPRLAAPAFYAIMFALGVARGDRDAALRGVAHGRRRVAEGMVWGVVILALALLASHIMHHEPF